MASSTAAEPGTRLSDRTRRSSLGLRVMVLLMHVVFVGAVFILDSTLDRRIHEEPWYIGVYGVLVLLTLAQYLYTAGSSPGYVVDVMRAGSTMHATFINTAALPKQSSSRNGNINSPTSRAQLQKLSTMNNTSSWAQMVMDLYPPGSSSRDWTCTYCRVIQVHRVPGTVMTVINVFFSSIITAYGLELALAERTIAVFGEWYIFEETILCIWTVALYIESLRLDIDKAWWKDFVGVIMLAVLIFILIFLLLLLLFHSYIALTNQTTYEVARRKRIFYLREFLTEFIRSVKASVEIYTISVALVRRALFWKLCPHLRSWKPELLVTHAEI
ncbi:hypothetical protein ACP70R_027568 [Stipagrostis hirtigluma subsp. patula]